MNLIAIDIGNTNVKVAFFLDDTEQQIVCFSPADEGFQERLGRFLEDCWEQVPLVASAAEPIRNGVIVVSSVNPETTEWVRQICLSELGEKIKVIGQDVPLPIETSVDSPFEVGTDRLITAAAAYSVVEDAVVVADFGTAVTIDLVDEAGVFVGGTISPGFEMALGAMHEHTARLPAVSMQKPVSVYGVNTSEAMRAGVYWAAVGLLETLCRKYAEQLGRWPHVILTGGNAAIFKDDCEFVDSYVPDLAVRGIMIAWKKSLFEADDIERLDD
ncbi:MAG: type III pantothenate kinase [Phycisphaerae bacterium]|nr:type III pantothenate kinase [Phycisphaerae bacterium]